MTWYLEQANNWNNRLTIGKCGDLIPQPRIGSLLLLMCFVVVVFHKFHMWSSKTRIIDRYNKHSKEVARTWVENNTKEKRENEQRTRLRIENQNQNQRIEGSNKCVSSSSNLVPHLWLLVLCVCDDTAEASNHFCEFLEFSSVREIILQKTCLSLESHEFKDDILVDFSISSYCYWFMYIRFGV